MVISLFLSFLFVTTVFSSCDVSVIQSSKGGDRLTEKPSVKTTSEEYEGIDVITIDPTKTFQTIEGFGGTFSDSSAYVFSQLPPELQMEVLNAYFSPPPIGHNYSLCRIPIGSTDFTYNGSYSYDESPNDFNLVNFSIAHDEVHMIPFMLQSMEHKKEMTNSTFKLFGVPWSAPGWMKRNGQMINSKMPGLIQTPQVFTSWAKYLSLFVTSYEASGLPIWGLEVQCEPRDVDIIPFECMGYKGDDEGKFVRDYLGPLLRKEHPTLKIMIYADQKDSYMPTFLTDYYSIDGAEKYVDAITYHWYGDFLKNYEVVSNAHLQYGVPVMSTAATIGSKIIKKWTDGMHYAIDIINGLNHYSSGWVDWNMLLDYLGGPTHAFTCNAQLRTTKDYKKIKYEYAYWHMGHFSRYIPPGSVRVETQLIKNSDCEKKKKKKKDDEELLFVGLRRPDGDYCVVVTNQNEKEMDYQLKIGDRYAKISMPELSTQTLLFEYNCTN